MNLLFAFFAVLLATAAPRAFAADLSWSPIYWESAKIGDRTVDKAALLVSVQLDGKARPIRVQLDLGANLSQFDSVAYEELFGKGAAPHDKLKKLPFTGVFGGASRSASSTSFRSAASPHQPASLSCWALLPPISSHDAS